MNRRAQAIGQLEFRLGHVFADQALLERALTHASAGGGARKLADNERLEFLGDRVLGLVIAEALCEREPSANAGDLSKRLHGLVSGEACTNVARDIGLGEALRLPHGETRRGARDQGAILADACEAVIAALYLELGLEGVRRILLNLWRPLLDAPHDPATANPKSELQEWAAANGKPAPIYRVLARSGPDHQPVFTLEVSVEDEAPEIGLGGSVRVAEKAAALALLQRVRPEL
ncbi:MAG TPA: ribonuclease III [Caulobacteraceae bacterium]